MYDVLSIFNIFNVQKKCLLPGGGDTSLQRNVTNVEFFYTEIYHFFQAYGTFHYLPQIGLKNDLILKEFCSPLKNG